MLFSQAPKQTDYCLSVALSEKTSYPGFPQKN